MHTSVDPSFLLPLLRRAGEMMIEAHAGVSDEAITVKPGSANFVTVYDVRIQQFLMREILAEIPEAYFIAEEQENDVTALQHECCFVIDPIDGTTNFIHDFRHSCISLAVLSRGEVVFGAIYDPYLREMFWAQKGRGAYLNDAPMHVSDHPLERAMVLFGTSPYQRARMADVTLGLCRELLLETADIRRSGSAALDLAYTAAGRNDLFFEFTLSPWDIAAGYLLITEAGGIMTDMRGRRPTFTEATPIIAATPQLYPHLLELAGKYLPLVREE